MANLSQTEVWFLDECIRGEKLLLQKVSSCVSQVRDPQLRQMCQEVHDSHRRHFDMLTGQVGR
jgi:spore coat protein CotF